MPFGNIECHSGISDLLGFLNITVLSSLPETAEFLVLFCTADKYLDSIENWHCICVISGN